MADQFDILLIANSPACSTLINMHLREAYNPSDYTLTHGKDVTIGLSYLTTISFDIILLDLSPGNYGLETFQQVFERVPETPIIVFTGPENENIGLLAMKSGAQDAIAIEKIRAKGLRRAINYAIDRNDLLKELSEKTKKLKEKTTALIKETAKLSQAQKLAHIGSWEWDIHNNLLTWSDELCDIYGLKRGEFASTTEAIFEKIHPEDRDLTKNIIEDAYKTLQPFNFYHRIVGPNNKIRTVHAIGKVVKNNQGVPITMFGTGQDVTERVHGEELERLATAATKSFNSVMIANKKGEIEWVNDGFTRLTGYRLDELKDADISPFKLTCNNSSEGSLVCAFSKTPTSFEREFLTKDGQRYWVISTITPVLDPNGEIEKIIAIDTDITERKRIEEELVRTNTIKEQFLTNMSHEIRTPMNAIVGFTDLVLKTELSPDQRQYIDAIKTSGRNLIVIINDILDFSKIEAGKITFEQIEFDLRHLISTLTELMLPKSMEKNIRISTKIDDRIQKQLKGDPTRLNQIFLNLVGNAVKFTEKGGIKIIAEYVSEDNDEIEVRFSVTDTGIGISADKLGSIFEVFTQATNDTNRKYGGTGLGLTIVKQLVELQGGKVSVKSKLGQGSSFSFNLKFKKVLSSDITTKYTLTTKEKPSHIESLNILLVEDNLMNQILAKKVLTNWNWNVDVAENGLVAVKKTKKTLYDLILMDIQMPEMDGYEATRQIRRRHNTEKRNIPIIAITAHAISGEAEKCYNAGMNDYITKPFDEQILYEKIISICKKNEDSLVGPPK